MTSIAVPGLSNLLRERLGEVELRPAERGFSSDFTGIAEGAHGRAFVKAMRHREGGRLASLRREEQIAPHLRGIAPGLLWSAECDQWVALGFEVADGRCTNFAPGSPDLPAVVSAIERIGSLPLPDVAREWHETRWDRFTRDPDERALLRGNALLHTDINPSNFLLGDRMWVVDWAWPTRGAALINPACFVVQLVSAGHSAAEAEKWAEGCAAWCGANPRALDAFAVATTRMYRSFAQRRGATWLTAMADAAEAWATHRGVADRLNE